MSALRFEFGFKLWITGIRRLMRLLTNLGNRRQMQIQPQIFLKGGGPCPSYNGFRLPKIVFL
jgi:hypothetical protein